MASALLATTAIGAPAWADEDLSALVKNADAYGNLRYRYEFVDQAGFTENANASTLRVRAGVTSGSVAGFSVTAEAEGVLALESTGYNDTVNGHTQYPVVADPDDLVLNQLYLRWRPDVRLDAKAGRQALNIDNQRWVGSVGWRQNDQTVDAVYLAAKPVEGMTASYGYVWRVNRIFGPDSPQGIWRDNQIHLFNIGYALTPALTVTGYAYLLDIPDAPLASSKTFGLRAAGEREMGEGLTLNYAAEYARQSDYGDNPGDYGLDYWHFNPGLSYQGVAVSLGYERLEGDGARALQTPLATLHAFNGWADKFLSTPANGLRDLYADITWKPAFEAWAKGATLKAVYHDFKATHGGFDYGHEWDAMLMRGFGKNLVLTAKYARYLSDGFATDTSKFWLMAEVKF